jgi:hypothetical protein
MTGKATATSKVEELIESRLREIEEQLRPLAELEQERRRLSDALEALRGTRGSAAAPAAARPTAPKRRPRRRSGAGGRAPRGSNLSAILEYVAANPGATAGEIAAATGISRGVVYSATSRLSSSGKLARDAKSDGQVGYSTAA